MSEPGTPTYASLTPANPSIVNGLASVELPSLSLIDSNSPASNMDVSSPQTPTSISDLKNDSFVDMDKSAMIAVIQFLKRGNLKATEELLRKECGFFEPVDLSEASAAFVEEGEVLAAYKTEGDPAEYLDCYRSLTNFVEKSLDAYKHEVSAVLYPVLAHMYLELVYNGHRAEAQELLGAFAPDQEAHYLEDLRYLSLVTTKAHMTGQPLLNTLLSGEYTVRMSRDSLAHLKRFLSDPRAGPIPRIVQDRLNLDLCDGQPRSKHQVQASLGSITGEAPNKANKTKIYYGLLKEPELQSLIAEEEEGEDDADKPRKKKSKKDALQKNKRNDPNAPPANRIPLPDLRDQDRIERARTYRDSLKRVPLSREVLPSVCFYTFMNSTNAICSVEISDDSSLMAFGTAESTVVVQSVTPAKLKAIKPTEQLLELDKDSDDVLARMLEERGADVQKSLHGHSGPVYSVSISPDRSLLLSCSEDSTIRLWSLHTWTCLVVFRGHQYPVWSVQFSPYGYYFVSGAHDRTARLWATDQPQALRVFAGHYSDVDVVEFHPNCNYVATGSSDRSVRLWDIHNGFCTRLFTGHKSAVSVLCFSPCGRYLASGGRDHQLLLWDLGVQGSCLLASFLGHTETLYTLAFSRDGNILASGGLDCLVKLWDFTKVTEEGREDEAQASIANDDKGLLLDSFPTKKTPVLSLHFTRRNVLLAAGPYNS